MSDQENENIEPPKPSMKDAFAPGNTTSSGELFGPDECTIYVNKITKECFIFHSKPVEQNIDRLEYDPKDHSVTVIHKDGIQMDLGVKIQWMIRSYFTKATEIGIVQTKDGEVVDGFMVPLLHK